ncbi:MAG: 3-dehydroquinate synthase, partial [Maricaulis sp.]|nr:3-dehydroquinate synthase [Maricaulis sp.]
MRDDKKNQDGRITLILARGIGNAYIETNVDEEDLVAFLETKLK